MTPRRLLTRFRPLLLGLLVSCGGACHGAESAAFEVQLVVPSELRPLLEPHLQIMQERQDPKLSEARFQFLARRTPEEIRDLLTTEGYFSPTIEQSVVASEAGWRAVVTVDPGQAARVVSVDLDYRGDFASDGKAFDERAQGLRKAWPLRAGMVFRDALWSEGKATLLKQLHSELYPAARIVESLAEVDPEQHGVSLRVVVDSGPRFSFGDLEISGIETLPEQIISGLNHIKPGSP